MARSRNQPQYDFISGAEDAEVQYYGAAFLASSMKPGKSINKDCLPKLIIGKDPGNDGLRAQIHKLQYELDSLKQERESTTLRHEDELRQAQGRSDGDYKRAQAAEAASHAAAKKHESLSHELEELHEQQRAEKQVLERRLRAAEEARRTAREELDEAQNEMQDQERYYKHEMRELQAKADTLQKSTEDLTQDRNDKTAALEEAQERLREKEETCGRLENEILQLKTSAGDSDTLTHVKKELSEQVAHIKDLEETNLNQRIELKKFRAQQKAIEVVEEEKRALETRTRVMGDLRKELSEAQLQRQLLEDERKHWTSYLEDAEGDIPFSTPETLAKAYTEERLERLSLVDQLGKVKPEISAKEEIITMLESEKDHLAGELEKLQAATENGTISSKDRTRLERHRALAVKEVEYLRARLKMFDTEEDEFNPERRDEANNSRVQELEDLVDQLRTEIQQLSSELSKSESQAPLPPQTPSRPLKRPLDSPCDERLGEFSRRNRGLQDEITRLTTSYAILQKEAKALRAQVTSMNSESRTRILEFRNNPTANAERIKQSTLDTLRTENVALLEQLEKNKSRSSRKQAGGESDAESSKSMHKMVPQASLDRLRRELEGKEVELLDKDKSVMRFKQVFAKKSVEFSNTVTNLLGWKVEFLPNGRARFTSTMYPTQPGHDEDEEHPHSIVFDDEKETMKVGGGPKSAFASEIRELIEFWVDGRRNIPCFLAACTLDFAERNTRAIGVR